MSSAAGPRWYVIATFPDIPSAHAIVGLLRSEGVPAEVVSDTPILGEVRPCEVRVPHELAHRARWLMAEAQFTDAELTFLATGKLEGGDDADK